jgi:hypothetical protein
VLLPEPTDRLECACSGVRGLRRLASLDARSHLAQQDVRSRRIIGRVGSQSNHRGDSLWEAGVGFSFPNGDIFDRISASPKTLQRRLYAGDPFPMMAALKGIHLSDIGQYEHFAADLQGPFPYNYVFIEPSYCLLNDYKGSTSEHPLDDVRLGEGLIKATY